MRTLSLDYHHNRRKLGWSDTLLLAGGVVTAIYVSSYSVNLFAEINTLEAKQTAVERKPEQRAPDPKRAALDAQQLQAEVKQANEVLAQLAMPWDTLFKEMESSQRDQVALLSIEPDFEKRIIKVTGEARDFDAMLGYIRTLQKKGSLSDVYLQSHNIEQGSAEKPLHFALVASWVTKL